jgi:hypothetical protein
LKAEGISLTSRKASLTSIAILPRVLPESEAAEIVLGVEIAAVIEAAADVREAAVDAAAGAADAMVDAAVTVVATAVATAAAAGDDTNFFSPRIQADYTDCRKAAAMTAAFFSSCELKIASMI